MAKGKPITDEVKAEIVKVYLKHPSYRAKEVQAEVHRRLRDQNPRISPDWPGLSTVQKTISPIRSLPQDPEDSRWSIYTLAFSDISADALPVVLEAYGLTIKWKLEKPLTVREAKWVARLYRVLTNIEELTIVAQECASNERIGEITGKPRPSLIDGDFLTRAVTGKPGITYKYTGDGNFQMAFHHSELWELDIVNPE